jgi:hypothetical protein
MVNGSRLKGQFADSDRYRPEKARKNNVRVFCAECPSFCLRKFVYGCSIKVRAGEKHAANSRLISSAQNAGQVTGTDRHFAVMRGQPVEDVKG